MQPAPARRRFKILGLTLGFSLALIAVLAWWWRDLPRLWLQVRLAAATGAEVEIESLTLTSSRRAEIRGLTLRRPDLFPGLLELTVRRVDAMGELGALRRGVLEEVTLEGTRAVFGTAAPPTTGLTDGGTAPPFEIRRLRMPQARILTAGAADTDAAVLDVDLGRYGGRLSGSVDLQAGSVDLAPFFSWLDLPSIGGVAEDLQVHWRLDAPPKLRADASRLEIHTVGSDGEPLKLMGLEAGFELGPPETESEPGLAAWRGRAHAADVRLRGPGLGFDLGRTELDITPGEDRWDLELRSPVIRSARLRWLTDGGGLEGQVEGFETRAARLYAPGVRGLDATLDTEIEGPFLAPRVRIDGQLRSLQLEGAEPVSLEGASAQAWPIVDPEDLHGARWRLAGPIVEWLGLVPAELLAEFPEGAAVLAGQLTAEGEWRFGSASAETTGGEEDASMTVDATVLGFEASFDAALRASGRVSSRIELRLASQPAGSTAGSPAPSSVEMVAEMSANLSAQLEVDAGPLGRLPLHLDGRLHSDGPSFTLDNLDMEIPSAEPLTSPSEWGSGRLSGTAEALDFEWQGLGLGSLQERLAGRFGIPTRDDVAAQGSASTKLRWHPGSVQRVEGELRLEGVGASDAVGARVVEGLVCGLDFTAEASPSAGMSASATGHMGGFLMLWDAYFGDLSDLENDLELSFRSPGPQKPRGESGAWTASLDLIPQTEAAATRLALTLGGSPGDTGPLRAELDLTSEDLSDLNHGVLKLFQTEAPALEELQGSASLKARVLFPAPSPGTEGSTASGSTASGSTASGSTASGTDVDVTGHLRLEGVAARLRAIEVAGLEMELPIDLRQRAGGITGPILEGSLSLGRSRFLDLELPAIASKLRLEGDTVALVEPLTVGILGGEVTLDQLTARDLLGAFELEAGVAIAALSMERLTAAVGLPALAGQLDGSLPRVRVDLEHLTVDGGGTIRLFGGEIRVRDITGRQILTSFPRFRLSADFSEIDLGQLTRRFDFGEMRGVVEGTVDEAVVVGGVPVAFSARLESVERPGVPQTVDVKAVQNLTVLGTGARPSLFDRGMQRFLKRYRYRKLGLSVALENDLLELRGLIREGERELFLQGGLVLGIDVVNAAPGQRISYSAMLRRLENLDFSAVRTE